MIQRREIHPGDRLTELELTERFGVSRGRIREALHSLESAGVVKIEPRRGAKVSRFSDVEVIDGYEIAMYLLSLTTRRAAERGTPEEKQQIFELAREFAAARGNLTIDEHLRQVSRIIKRLSQAARNVHLGHLVDSMVMTGPPAIFGRTAIATPARRRQAASAWQQLAQLVRDGEGAKAEAIVRRLHSQGLKTIAATIGG